MKALCFLFISILGGFVACAQSNLERYYKNSIEATSHICKSEYSAAKASYKKAFSSASVPFFIDINNAVYAEVNSGTPDKTLIREYLLLLQKKGICIHAQYERLSKFHPYVAAIPEDGCFSVEDKSAKTLIEDCIKRDQVLRKFSHEQLSAQITYDPTLLPAINMIDSVNYVLMDSLLHAAYKRGINIENLVGRESANSITTILLHNEPWGRTNKPFWDSCIYRGVLEARNFTWLYDDFCNGYYEDGKIDSKWNKEQQADPVFGVYGFGCIAQFRDYAYISQIWDTAVYSRIQAKRDALFVGDVYENAKILAYAYYHTEDGFLYPTPSILFFPDVEKNMEGNLKKQNKKFILYRGKADFDYNRKW